MKLRHCSVLAVALLGALSTAAVAGSRTTEMPNSDWDFLSAKLMNAGYTDIRMVSEDSGYIVAFDSQGSEVLLLVDPLKHVVMTSTYVHMGDN